MPENTDSPDTIIIDLSRANTPKVWDGKVWKSKDNNPDPEQTDSVFSSLKELAIKINEVTKDEGSRYSYGSDAYKPFENQFIRQSVGEHNSIISIVGNRGSGKSSILRSVPNMFHDDSSNKDDIGIVKENFKDIINHKTKFFPLPVTDPAVFKKNDSLIESYVSMLFTYFEANIQKKKSEDKDCDDSSQKRLLKAFKDIKTALQVARLDVSDVLGKNLNDSSYSELRALENLSAGNSLRSKIATLTHYFLKWKFDFKEFTETNAKERANAKNISLKVDKPEDNYYIVLTIDDLDLFTGDVIQVVEDLRNLIQIPGLIVITALRIEQLTESVEAYYRQTYEHLLKNGGQLSEDPDQMAGRYIEKIFPLSRRLETSNIHELTKRVLLTNSSTDKWLNEDKQEGIIFKDPWSCIRDLFLSKSGIALEKDLYGGLHPLMPTSFRSFIQTVVFLDKLQTIYSYPLKSEDLTEPYSEKISDTAVNNCKKVLQEWIPFFIDTNLESRYKTLILKTLNHPNQSFNKSMVKIIRAIIIPFEQPQRTNKERIDLSGEILLSKYYRSDYIQSQEDTNDESVEFESNERGTELSQHIRFNTIKKVVDSYQIEKISYTLDNIYDLGNIEEQVSLGDVLLLLDHMKNITISDRQLLSITSLMKLIYSCKLVIECIKTPKEARHLIGSNYINPQALKCLNDLKINNAINISRTWIPYHLVDRKSNFIATYSSLYGQIRNSNFRKSYTAATYNTNSNYLFFSPLQLLISPLFVDTLTETEGDSENISAKYKQDFKDLNYFIFPIQSIESFEIALLDIAQDRNLRKLNKEGNHLLSFWQILFKSLEKSFEYIKKTKTYEILTKEGNSYFEEYKSLLEKLTFPTIEQPKRGRGRKPGSKNKPKSNP